MATTIEVKVFHISERLPPVQTPVMVFTKGGSNYIAARFEIQNASSNTSVNQIRWGLVYNRQIIGEVTAVTHWCQFVRNLEFP